MKNDKNFTSFEEQIKLLKSRNMIFHSEENCLSALRRFGYYNIINGYKEPYVEIIDEKERYKDGTSFEQIFSLYTFDRRIRSAIMEAMLEVEDNLKTAVAHVISENFSSKESNYLLKSNYKLGKKRNGTYQLDDIFNKFDKIKNDDSEPYKHYRLKHNNIPPWILFKGASFGNMVNFLKLQKSDQKDAIIALIYNLPTLLIGNIPELKNGFMDTAFMCLEYRNIAAHGGRIYNFKPKSSFRYNVYLHKELNISEADYRHGKGHKGIPMLLSALKHFDNINMNVKLEATIDFYLNDHCNKYPNDTKYLTSYIKLL